MASDLDGVFRLEDVHKLALAKLDPAVAHLIDGGAGDGACIEANEKAFADWALRARVLSGVSEVSLTASVLGEALGAPLLLAPSGLQGLSHPEGELASAAAASEASIGMVLSTHSTFPVEQVAAIGAPLWFQLYFNADRAAVRDLVQRAEAAGCKALCLTTDMPTRPWIHAQMRAALAAVAHVEPAHGAPRQGHLDAAIAWDHDSRLTWDDLEWLRSITAMPLVLKGVMTGEDAALAVQHGVAGVVVSNHGGRVLEQGRASLAALPEIVESVAGGAEIYFDGGVRRGGDIAIALALGARAVLVGRPVPWGLAAGGRAGVRRVIDMLLGELRSVMFMLGARTPAEITRTHVARR
jgi:4-hydroxymandelate oxidase